VKRVSHLFVRVLMKWVVEKLHFLYKFVGVAAELTGALENSVKGQAVDLKVTLNNCTKIFPDLFSQSPQKEQHVEVTAVTSLL
jgi:hypothetical protein